MKESKKSEGGNSIRYNEPGNKIIIISKRL